MDDVRNESNAGYDSPDENTGVGSQNLMPGNKRSRRETSGPSGDRMKKRVDAELKPETRPVKPELIASLSVDKVRQELKQVGLTDV